VSGVSTALAPASFRAVARRFPTGVAVATSHAAGCPAGMTINAFTTVSVEPALLLVCLHERSRLLAAIRLSGVLAVTVLSAHQRDCARWFADSRRPSGATGFDGVPARADPGTGCLLLTEGIAYFAGSAEQLYPGGDHTIVIATVTSCGLLGDGEPLLFADGLYTRIPHK
jgi:flavin reductase